MKEGYPLMTTFTGRTLVPWRLTPADINIRDIARHLALTCRFNGALPAFYSVAQHSVHVSEYCPPGDALWGLLHDAGEAYLGDVIRPIKVHRSLTEFRMAEEIGLRAIAECFNLPSKLPESVKLADNRMLQTEWRDLRDGRDEALQCEPYNFTLKPVAWDAAELAFLLRFNELMGDAAKEYL
jgi:hypothetical protein